MINLNMTSELDYGKYVYVKKILNPFFRVILVHTPIRILHIYIYACIHTHIYIYICIYMSRTLHALYGLACEVVSMRKPLIHNYELKYKYQSSEYHNLVLCNQPANNGNELSSELHRCRNKLIYNI
jgi:hypothetical protein